MSTERAGKIGMTPRLAMQTIRDQASDVVDGWREGWQNAADSPGSDTVQMETDASRTVISDNGDGLDLNDEAAQNLLTDLGETSKEGDEDTIGQFGVGKGQIWAKARVTMMSGDVALHFDIKNWGLEYDKTDLEQPVDGLTVVMDHYTDEVPDPDSRKWKKYKERMEKRFKYMSATQDVKGFLNGKLITGDDPKAAVDKYKHRRVRETDDAIFAVAHNADDEIAVYSNGIFVKDIDGEGLTGVIVSKSNLDLNFARNDIKSGSDIWNRITDDLHGIRKDILDEVPDTNLNQASREAIADMMMEDGEQFDDTPVFRMTSGDKVSLEEIKESGGVGFAPTDNPFADKLIERGYIILDQNDDAVQSLDYARQNDKVDTPSQHDIHSLAEELGLNEGYDEVHDTELTAYQRRRLNVAREMADRLGIRREIVWGSDDAAAAWTDGENKIWLTESVFESNMTEIWLPKLYRTLVHEWAHDGESKGCSGHNSNWTHLFRKRLESNQWVYERVAEKLSKYGFNYFEPDGLTEHEQQKADAVRDEIRRCTVGDLVTWNGRATPVPIADIKDQQMKLRGPQGGEFKLDWSDDDSFPTLTNLSNYSDYTVTEFSLEVET